MKEFNLDKALAGHPVVTRDGRKVDELVVLENALRPLIIVIDGEVYSLYKDGCVCDTLETSSLDLFMAEESYYGFKEGEDCYVLSADGYYSEYSFSTNNNYLMDCLAQWHVFKSKEEVEKEIKYRAAKFRLNAKMRELEGDWKADWNDDEQPKFFFHANHWDGCVISTLSTFEIKFIEDWRYSNEETISWVIKNMAEDIKIVLGVEEQ